jgi:hypothetical protein
MEMMGGNFHLGLMLVGDLNAVVFWFRPGRSRIQFRVAVGLELDWNFINFLTVNARKRKASQS